MVTHYFNCPEVTGYTYITLFRDHEDPYTFWYINSNPRVTLDKNNKNKPVFDYTVIGRGKKIEGTEDVQQGRLVMSVNLALTEDEWKAVENTVKQYVISAKFDSDLKKYYLKKQIDAVENQNKWLRNNTVVRLAVLQKVINNIKRQVMITIRPVEFKSGSASINIGTFDDPNHGIYETKPNLFGDCNATFAANLGTQDSQTLYKIFKPEEKTNNVNLSTTVNYEMTYVAMMPFRATATVHYERIYTVIRDLVQQHSGTDTHNNAPTVARPTVARPTSGVTRPSNNYVSNRNGIYSDGTDLYVSQDGISQFLRDTNSTNHCIEIKIEDTDTGERNEKYEEMILNSLSAQISEQVCDKMFEKITPIDPNTFENPNDVKLGETEKTAEEHSSTNTYGDEEYTHGSKDTTERKRSVRYDVCYRLNNDAEIKSMTDWSITIDKNKAMEFEANPNLSIELLLKGKAWSIDDLVKTVYAGDFYFQNIKVPIDVDSANFGRDIQMISVRVIYKDNKGNTKMDKVFNFNEENPGTQTFEVLMDRDDNGQLITKYYYQTKIFYRQFDIYDKNLREEDKWSALKTGEGINHPIYIHYVDMRNLCVNCEASDVAWDEIDKLDVEFKYRDAPDKNGATKTLHLTQDNPTDTWNCFMYADNSFYNYRVHYFYRDGTDDWSETFESASNNLTINDKLSGVFRVRFDIYFQKSIEKVRVIVKCQGKEEDSGWFTQSDTWTWETRLKEDGEKSYQYRYQYYLVNGDESIKSSEWTAPKSTDGLNQVTETIDLGVEKTSLVIDGDSLDWKKWNRVYVHIKYDDDANNLHYSDEDQSLPLIKLNSDDSNRQVIIPVMNTEIKPKIWVQYIPQNSTEVIPSDEVTVSGLVLLPHAAPPLHDVTPPAESSAPNPPAQAVDGGSPAPEPEPTPEPEPEPVERDLDLTFSIGSMDWEKWLGVWIYIKYDDDANGIYYSEQNLPPFKFTQNKSEDKTVTIHVKNPDIRPIVTAQYISSDGGDTISSEETPMMSETMVLPDNLPPKE